MAGIYFHIPFCKQACHYCNFHFSTNHKAVTPVLDAMAQELVQRKKALKGPLESIYFGGGSPSLVPPEQLAVFLNLVAKHFSLSETVEVTLELNPDDGTTSYLEELKRIGINRLSVGVQSFQNDELQLMHRAHTAAESHKVLETVATLFDNFSMDLIYGMPNSTQSTWQQNIATALSYTPPHIAAYALTVEPKTTLAHWVKNKTVTELPEEAVQAQYNYLVEELQKVGYANYEFSNFGKPGYYAVNNSNYWKGKPYLGIGPSAHSYDGNFLRSWNIAQNTKYVNAILAGELPLTTENLSTKDRFNEYIMTGLRTEWGVDTNYISSAFGPTYAAYLEQQVAPHLELQHLFWDGDTLRIPQKARFLSDGIAADLFLVELQP